MFSKQEVEAVPTWVEYQPNQALLSQVTQEQMQSVEAEHFFAPDLELCSRIRLATDMVDVLSLDVAGLAFDFGNSSFAGANF